MVMEMMETMMMQMLMMEMRVDDDNYDALNCNQSIYITFLTYIQRSFIPYIVHLDM